MFSAYFMNRQKRFQFIKNARICWIATVSHLPIHTHLYQAVKSYYSSVETGALSTSIFILYVILLLLLFLPAIITTICIFLPLSAINRLLHTHTFHITFHTIYIFVRYSPIRFSLVSVYIKFFDWTRLWYTKRQLLAAAVDQRGQYIID